MQEGGDNYFILNSFVCVCACLLLLAFVRTLLLLRSLLPCCLAVRMLVSLLVHALLLLLLLRLSVATVVLRSLVPVFLFGRAGRFQGLFAQHCTLCIARWNLHLCN